ncbi:hypothetical protein DAPPUDRAFT_266643 [Daphnia pulex]|uniref:Methyltransferase domain-containing protein n=1 Tax=Daphnia pulex TaxID=6669 RepID=E9HVC7_DAPPU|nr:hypothetical protein DAPPUDRAFT_266643 [Daphnia pulex]|eukprot:EFX64307.1 hypothetical protein DAPPUDRAFT_266643 [Daphnia pulex]
MYTRMGHLLEDRRIKLFRSRNLALRLTLYAVACVGLSVIVFVVYSPFRQQILLRVPMLQSLIMAGQKPAESMSPEEVFQYLHWTNCAACQLPVDFGFVMARSGNPGGVAHPDGQKLVCLDQFIAPVFNNCLVYSFGINNQWTFDEDMAQFGCHVYSFDPSMGAKDHNRTDKIHFFNLGLAKEDGQSPNGWKMKTASSIYEMLGDYHGRSTLVDVFKMDIEFYEWEVLPQMLQSGFLADKVKQLAVEIHFNAGDPLENYQKRIRILQDLESIVDTINSDDKHVGGFIRFSSRINPGLKRAITILGNKPDFVGYELTWYNSKFYNSPSKEGPVFPYYQ